MRICIIGEYSGEPDEAMRKISYNLADHLSKRNEVYRLDLLNLSIKKILFEVKSFDPDILHYIHGPTPMSFFLLKLLSIRCPRAKTVISAMHPHISNMPSGLVRVLKSDLTLTQSRETDDIFRELGLKTLFYACGVDTNQFSPADPETKNVLREKLNIPPDKFVILHIGSIKEGRNVELLCDLVDKENHVLIVGPVSVGKNSGLEKRLRENGIDIRGEYIKNIEEIYLAADCYVYPVLYKRDKKGKVLADSIEMPLTVVEALSCNLPVISTRFAALPQAFNEGNGLFYAESTDEFVSAVHKIKNGAKIETREKVHPMSWELSVSRLEEIYRSL